MTRRMTRVMMALVAALAIGAAPALAQEETERVDETVRMPDGGTLVLKNFSGRIRIEAASGNDVVIRAVRRAERPQLDNIKLTIETSGSRVEINANDRNPDWQDRENNVVNTEFEIRVPASARLDVDAFSSRLDVIGVTGDQNLKTFSGDITVTGARGRIEANSFNGSVDIDVTSASGDPDVEIETFSGDIRTRLASGASGRVEFNTFSGSLDSDLPLSMRQTSRRRTTADLPGGGSGGRLQLKTFSGDVEIRR